MTEPTPEMIARMKKMLPPGHLAAADRTDAGVREAIYKSCVPMARKLIDAGLDPVMVAGMVAASLVATIRRNRGVPGGVRLDPDDPHDKLLRGMAEFAGTAVVEIAKLQAEATVRAVNDCDGGPS